MREEYATAHDNSGKVRSDRPGIAWEVFHKRENLPVMSKKAAANSSPPPGLASENVEMTAD
jgi:hypothetical protein